jgi:hypothetical protein
MSDLCKDGKPHDYDSLLNEKGEPLIWKLPRKKSKLLGTQVVSLLTRERCKKCGKLRTRQLSQKTITEQEAQDNERDQNT